MRILSNLPTLPVVEQLVPVQPIGASAFQLSQIDPFKSITSPSQPSQAVRWHCMLDAYIIDRIRKEREQSEEQSSQIPLYIDDRPPPPQPQPEPQDSGRGTVIIDDGRVDDYRV